MGGFAAIGSFVAIVAIGQSGLRGNRGVRTIGTFGQSDFSATLPSTLSGPSTLLGPSTLRGLSTLPGYHHCLGHHRCLAGCSGGANSPQKALQGERGGAREMLSIQTIEKSDGLRNSSTTGCAICYRLHHLRQVAASATDCVICVKFSVSPRTSTESERIHPKLPPFAYTLATETLQREAPTQKRNARNNPGVFHSDRVKKNLKPRAWSS